MDSDYLAERARILAECDALPDDPEAQAIAQAIRGSGRPFDPFADRMRGLPSDYALAIVDGDLQRQRESAQAIRMMIAAAMVPGSSLAH